MTKPVTPPHAPAAAEEPPPMFGSWAALYAAVIALLAAILVFLRWLTERWS